jgi:hypothetical protein
MVQLPEKVWVICSPCPPYAGGLLVSWIGAFYNYEEASVAAEGFTSLDGERHWAVELETCPDVKAAGPRGWEQLSFPEDWSRARGQSAWGVDLALATAHRWGI